MLGTERWVALEIAFLFPLGICLQFSSNVLYRLGVDHPLPRPLPWSFYPYHIPTHTPTLTRYRPFQDWFFMSCTMIHLRRAGRLHATTTTFSRDLCWAQAVGFGGFSLCRYQVIDRDINRSRRFFRDPPEYQVHVLAKVSMPYQASCWWDLAAVPAVSSLRKKNWNVPLSLPQQTKMKKWRGKKKKKKIKPKLMRPPRSCSFCQIQL